MHSKLSFAELRQIMLDGLNFSRDAGRNIESDSSRDALNQLAQAKDAALAFLEGDLSASALITSDASSPCYLVHEEYRVLAALIKGRPWKLPLRELIHIEDWIQEALEASLNSAESAAQHGVLTRYTSQSTNALTRLETAQDFTVPGTYRGLSRTSSYII